MSLPHHVFTTHEIKAIEQEHAKKHNGHCFDLMEKAGRAVFDELRKVNYRPSMVYVLVGKGNNGGDGYIVASYLLTHRIPFRLFAVGMPHEDSEAFAAASYFKKLGGKVETELPDLKEEERLGNSPDLMIDALLGTGLNSAPREPYVEWIKFINTTRAYVISIDVPSGVNADTGKVYSECVLANKTICMMGLKCGLLTGDSVDFVGEIIVNDLGVDMVSRHGTFKPETLPGASQLPIFLATYEDIKADLPVRTPSANKGDSGKVLLIGGAMGMGGAICICGQGALRAGAGLAKVATDARNITMINAQRPELMTVDFNDRDAVSHAIEWADVIAIGPGLGTSLEAQALLDQALAADKPTVIDADALNIIARAGMPFAKRSIMTPHPGEAARLLNCTIEEINEDRFKSVYELQKRCGGVVLLKGAGTLICDGSIIIMVHEGSPSMATGGMGDILTGLIAALRAQGLTQMQSTVAAACIHGRAGFISGEHSGIIGTLATDLLPYIRYLVNKRPGLAAPRSEIMDIAKIEARTHAILMENQMIPD